MIKVINIKNAPSNWQSDPNYVYIGRTGKGLTGYFGNPIIVGKLCHVCNSYHNSGGSTLICYRKWLINKIRNDAEFKQNIFSLRNKILVCFCKPNPCHGDIVKQYLDAKEDLFA